MPRPSASISPSAIGVRTQPGQTQFARTPSGPWSRAMHCVSIASAAFEEQYARLSGAARRPATEAIVTIAPRRSSRCGIAARAIRKAPVTLTRKTRSKIAGSRSSSEPSPPMPALRTSASRPRSGRPSRRRRARRRRRRRYRRRARGRRSRARRPRSARRRRPVTATEYPSAASRRATAAPIPVPPPVTSATRLTRGGP